MFQKLKTFLKQRKCFHTFSGPEIVKGDWAENIPHPHPHFAERGMKITAQPFALVGVCFKCGKVSCSTGYNEKPVNGSGVSGWGDQTTLPVPPPHNENIR
jgi:hypothetical protein